MKPGSMEPAPEYFPSASRNTDIQEASGLALPRHGAPYKTELRQFRSSSAILPFPGPRLRESGTWAKFRRDEHAVSPSTLPRVTSCYLIFPARVSTLALPLCLGPLALPRRRGRREKDTSLFAVVATGCVRYCCESTGTTLVSSWMSRMILCFTVGLISLKVQLGKSSCDG